MSNQALTFQPSDTAKYEAVTKAVFHATILKLSSLYNAGVTSNWNKHTDETTWYIAGNEVGVSDGPIGTGGYYFIVRAQASLAV